MNIGRCFRWERSPAHHSKKHLGRRPGCWTSMDSSLRGTPTAESREKEPNGIKKRSKRERNRLGERRSAASTHLSSRSLARRPDLPCTGNKQYAIHTSRATQLSLWRAEGSSGKDASCALMAGCARSAFRIPPEGSVCQPGASFPPGKRPRPVSRDGQTAVVFGTPGCDHTASLRCSSGAAEAMISMAASRSVR